MIVLTLAWCLVANPTHCVKDPNVYEFGSVLECLVQAQRIGADHPKGEDYELHFRCGRPEQGA